MATPSGGKIRSKRGHNVKKPYERPRAKSLLSRVSETVKDLITPSWLNNLWANPNDDDGEGTSSRSSTPDLPYTNQVVDTPNSLPAAIATSTPDINYPGGKEALSVPRPVQQSTPNVQSDAVPDGAASDDDDVVIIDERPSTSRGIRLAHTTPLPFRNYADPIGTSTPNDDMPLLGGRKNTLDKDDASDTSVSTSGCSSLVPHLDKMDHKEKLSKKNLDRLSELGHSTPLASSSLWTDLGAGPSGVSSSRPQQAIGSATRPSFNSSYFGSPRLVGEVRPKNASPFYAGKTQFGGSSAQRASLKRGRTSPYEVHLPIKRNVRPKPAPVSTDVTLGATSSTARKILDTLDRMSSPLLDAKRIPLSPAASPYSFRPSSRLSHLRPGTSRTNEPPVSGLRVASQASIASNRRPHVTTVIDLDKEDRVKPSEKEASPSISATPTISTASSFRFGAPASTSTPASSIGGSITSHDKGGGKMKSKGRNTLHYSASSQEDDVAKVPDLPQVALPVKSLPKFNFGLSRPDSATTTKPSQPVAATPISSSTTISATKPVASAFKFSASSSSSTSKSEVEAQFKFSSPIVDQASVGSTLATEKSSSTKFTFSMPRQTPYSTSRPTSESKKPSFETPERTRRKGNDDDDVVEVEDDDDDEPSGGIKVAKELKTGSCLLALGILKTKNGPVPSSSSLVQAHSAKLSSSPMENGPLLPSTKLKTGSEPSKMNSFAEKFKPPASSWECDTCMIMNKDSVDKCVACSAERPRKKSSTVGSLQKKSEPSPATNSFDKFAKQANEWECDTCMIRNKDSLDKCAACTTPRPGGAKTNSASKAAIVAPVVKNTLADKFKAAAGEWECDTCMIRNKATVLKCVACETPKPGSQPSLSAPPASSFKFGSSPMSNGESSGAFKLGSALNSNLNNDTCAKPDLSGGFKIPSGFSFGQGSKPSASEANGPVTSSESNAGAGFKLPAGFSLKPAASDTSASAETKSTLSGGLLSDKAKAEDKSSAKLEVKVPVGLSFGSSKSTSESSSGGLKFGQTDSSKPSGLSNSIAPSGGFKFGQSPPTATQSVLDKEGPPPNVNLFDSKTEEDGPPSKRTVTFGGVSENGQDKKSETSKPAFTFGAAASATKELALTAKAPSFQFGAGTGAATFGDKSQTTGKTTESKPSFSFGSVASTSSASVSSTAPTFSFGNTASKPDSTTSSTEAKPGFAFTFGAQSTAASTQSQPVAPTFSFGAKTEAASTAPTPSTFTFGQAASQPATTAPAAAPTFSFGGAPKTEAATKPAAAFTFGGQTQTGNQGFNFGSSAVATSAPAQTTPSFNFGASANKPAETPASGGFNFGSTASTGSKPTFAFGSTSNTATPSPAFGAPASTSTSTFTFGATTTTASSNPFGGTAQTNSTPFGGASQSNSTPFGAPSATPFGSAQQNATPFGSGGQTNAAPFGSQTTNQGPTFGSAPAFGAPSGGASQTPAFGGATNGAPAFGSTNSSAPAFGSGAAPSFGSTNTNQSSGGFDFGKPQAAPSFQFGAANSSTNNSSQGVFSFSGNQQNQAPQATPAVAPQPAGGFNFNTGPPSFNFGGNTPQPGATPFQFQASAPATNPFSASGTPGAQSGRKIKRAVRRTARK